MNARRRQTRGRSGDPNDDGPASAVALLGGAALGLATDGLLALVPRQKSRLLAGLARRPAEDRSSTHCAASPSPGST